MTSFMAYVILLSAGVGACAITVDLIVRARVPATRWVWATALAAVLVTAAFATVAPPPVSDTRTTEQSAVTGDGIAASTITVVAEAVPAESIIHVTDLVLPVAWVAASLLLLIAILYGQRRVYREHRDAESRTVNGRAVILTDNLGPAVAGIGRPVVLLPRWVLALDAGSQELLLAHEFEHVKRGDTRLLLSGAVMIALMPWNPVVWWLARRLRVAVEQDCDARVLAVYPDVRRYADLLLMTASRPRVSSRLLAAYFGEHRSDLDRRIQAMTDRTLRWRQALSAAAIAGILVVASCEAPRPEPLAPREGNVVQPGPVAQSSGPNFVPIWQEYLVEKPATMTSASSMPRYPEILRQAGVEGEVLVSFVVNEDGTADPSSLEIIRSTHELFATAVKRSLPTMRFVAAEIRGRKVKQLVTTPFTFDLPGTDAKDQGILSTVKASERGGKRLAFSVNRAEKPALYEQRTAGWHRGAVSASEPRNFELRSSTGDVVSLYSSRDVQGEIRVDDVASIEVYKPALCPTSAQTPCPLIRIVLKPGREAAYRNR